MPNKIVLIKTDVQPAQTISLSGSMLNPITLEAGTYTVCKDGFKFGKFVVSATTTSTTTTTDDDNNTNDG